MEKNYLYRKLSLHYELQTNSLCWHVIPTRLALLVCILLCGTSYAKDDTNTICHAETGYAIPPANPKVTFGDKALALVGYEGKIDEFCIMGVAALSNDMLELAIDYCYAALRCNRDCWKPWAVMAMCYMKKLAKNDSETYENKLCNSLNYAYLYNKDRETFYFSPTDSITFYNVLRAYCEFSVLYRGHYDEIISIIQKELCYYPNDANLINTLSFAYTEKGTYNLAQQWANLLVQINPAAGYFRLGYIAEEQNNYQQAIEYYDKVLGINSEDTIAKRHRDWCDWCLRPY